MFDRDGTKKLALLSSTEIPLLLPLPDFITSARRELMLSAAFLAFLGGIVTR
jgi:hypothetical protein